MEELTPVICAIVDWVPMGGARLMQEKEMNLETHIAPAKTEMESSV
jgi:hypothetical protein